MNANNAFFTNTHRALVGERTNRTRSFAASAFASVLLFAGTLSAQSIDPVEQRCMQGDGDACFNAGSVHEQMARATGGLDPMAQRLYERGCRLGSGISCGGVGYVLRNGRHGAADDRAAEYAARACERGVAVECLNVAYFRREAHGSHPAALTLAAKAFGAACDLGDPRGCTGLAEMMIDGSGVLRDIENGERLAARACNAGDRYACTSLGNLYQYGEYSQPGAYVLPNTERAIGYYAQGCNLGYDVACILLRAQQSNDPAIVISATPVAVHHPLLVPAASIDAVLQEHQGELAACCTHEPDAPNLTFMAYVGSRGEVVGLTIAEGTAPRELEQCVLHAARAWTFPRTDPFGTAVAVFAVVNTGRVAQR